MKIIDVVKRPKKCPYCGGEVCDILWGMPTVDAEINHLLNTGRNLIIGGCVVREEGNPDYECEDCGLQFRKLSFPYHVKALARKALLKEDASGIFCDVEYVGLYRKQMVYEPIARQGICWDGIIRIFVDQSGKVKIRYGEGLWPVINKMQRDKEKFLFHDERFYYICAMRFVNSNGSYFASLRMCEGIRGKRTYRPILKEEYKNKTPEIDVSQVVIVDNNGRAKWVSNKEYKRSRELASNAKVVFDLLSHRP